MEKQYVARVIENGKTTLERTRSLQELTHWAYSDSIGDYSRHIEEGELLEPPTGPMNGSSTSPRYNNMYVKS